MDKKQRLVTELFTRLRLFDSNSINLCLKVLRILTREREGLDVRNVQVLYILIRSFYDSRQLRDHQC